MRFQQRPQWATITPEQLKNPTHEVLRPLPRDVRGFLQSTKRRVIFYFVHISTHFISSHNTHKHVKCGLHILIFYLNILIFMFFIFCCVSLKKMVHHIHICSISCTRRLPKRKRKYESNRTNKPHCRFITHFAPMDYVQTILSR